MLVFRRGHEHPGQRFQQRKEIIVNRHEKIASTIAARVSTGFALAAFAAVATLFTLPAQAGEIRSLRVCADPGNMPLSNQRGEGYQNKIAEVLGEALGTGVSYDWRSSIERGLLRGTLDANACDVMFDVPTDMERVLVTQPLYRSAFVLAYRSDRHYQVNSLEDPLLKKLKIGVYQTSAIRESLGQRDVKNNTVTHFLSYDGDRVPENQPSYQVQQVVDGKLDMAAIWGPFAGYYKTIKKADITLQPVNLMDDDRQLEFDMALAVRRGDKGLQQRLNQALVDNRDKIERILNDYGVPLVQCQACVIQGSLPSHGPYRFEHRYQTAAQPAGYGPDATLAQLKQWLKDGADPTRELANAALAGDLVRVRYLVEQTQADINRLDGEGYAPLHNAVRMRFDEITAYLLDHKANIEVRDSDQWTPLMHASWRDNAHAVNLLASKGADREARNSRGMTALSIASQYGKSDSAAALVKAGADLDHAVGGARYTPLMLASAGGWDSIVQALIAGGANVEARNGAGITALMIAAASNRAEAAKALIAAGAKLDARDDAGATALSIAQERGNDDVVEVLQQKASRAGASVADTHDKV